LKLYYAPGACSLSPHIVARECGVEVVLEKVDVASKKTASGKDFLAINPKGYVPALELDNGEVLTEGPVIAQYLADRSRSEMWAPLSGTLERYRLQEMLGFINSEVHKSFGPLFNPGVSAEVREERLGYLRKRFAFLDKKLAETPFLLGHRFSPADAYLFVMVSWAEYVKLDLSDFANVKAFQQRVAARPAVQAALRAEGLIQ
jgi:glutathione S-transferase